MAPALDRQRVPVSARGRGDGPGVAYDCSSVEIKNRRSVTAWRLDAMAHAPAGSRDGRTPVAINHRRSRRLAEDLAVRRLADLVTLLARQDGKEATP